MHFSTDYVFNETDKIPIVESCKKKPINKYGLSKHLGEEQILKKCKKYFIFRISWVYGKYGDNFPKKIIALAKKNKIIRVINDQKGIPTSTKFISQTISKIISKKEYLEYFGIYNIAPLGSATWYELALHIKSKIDYKKSSMYELNDIIPVKTEEYITNASRPNYSCLNNTKMINMFNIKTYNWSKYMDEYIDEIL
jgi:dTDP-4-dehydrorhamnose reductase